MKRLEFEARGVTCQQCDHLDVPAELPPRVGKCLASGTTDATRVFVRIHMARNCWYFAPDDSYQSAN